MLAKMQAAMTVRPEAAPVPPGDKQEPPAASPRDRLLNPVGNPPTTPIERTEAPEVEMFDLHGRRVALDCNTLAAAERAPGASAEGFGQAVRPAFPPHAEARVRRLVLNLTHTCNLACGYCFVRHGDPRRQTIGEDSGSSSIVPRPSSSAHGMSTETALRALDLLEGDIHVSFFGGEPLLAWPTTRAVMDRAEALARSRGVRASFHVTTNGTLLDGAKAAELKRRGCSLLVSLDGPADLHNAARPAKDPTLDSHAATLAALETLRRLGMSARTTARATYPMAAPRLVERLRYFAALQDDGLVAGFSIEPAVMAEGCAADDAGAFDPEALSAEYHAAAEFTVERLRAGRPVDFFHFRKMLSRLVHRRIAPSECGAGCGYVAVGPDGTIYACHRESGTRIGHLDAGIDEALRAPWRDNRWTARPACRRCWARNLCGGGCRQVLAERGRPLTETYAPRCAVMQTVLRECLWILTQISPGEARRIV